jgi:hypothetical protein
LVLCAAGRAPAQGASTFNDPQGRFSVQAPAGWTATALNSDAVQLSSGASYVTVLVLPNGDPAAAIDAIARQTAGQWRGFAEARRGDTRLSGLAGKYVTYAGLNPRGVDSYLEMLAVSRAGNTYLLMMAAPKAQFAGVKTALDQIERSFTLAAGAAGAPAAAPPAPAGAIASGRPASPPPAPASAAVAPAAPSQAARSSGGPLTPATPSQAARASGGPLAPAAPSQAARASGGPLTPATPSQAARSSGGPLAPATPSQAARASGGPLAPAGPSQAARTPAAPLAPAAGGGNYYRMKKVSVIDQHGFEKPMPAVSLLIPTDWQFQGDTNYAATFGGCHENSVQVSFRAASPDGRMAIEMFPSYTWQWSDDANAVQMMRMSSQQAGRSGGRPCEALPAMTAGEYLRRMVIPKARPNAQVVAVEPQPDVAQQAQEQARQYQQTAAQMGMQARIRADAARARLQYNLNGQAVEEWLTAVTYAAGVPGPSLNMRTGQMGQTMYYTCGAYSIMAMRAPQGELASKEKFFTIVRSTVHTEPEWNARVTQVLQNMAASDSKGASDRSAIIAQNGRDIGNIIHQTYENTSKAQERSQEKFDQYIRGVETYRNPSTGETFELSNQYAHAWVNGTNEYILTDSAFFNPNSTLAGHWTEAVPVQ